MALQRTTMYLSTHDRKALEKLRVRYGFATNSQAIRFALQTAAATPPQANVIPPAPLSSSGPPDSVREQHEEAAILAEKLIASQEELRLMQDALNQNQQELFYATQELQNLNRLLFERDVERQPPPRARVEVLLFAVDLEKEKHLGRALRQRAVQLQEQATEVCTKSLRLHEHTKEQVTQLERMYFLLAPQFQSGTGREQKGEGGERLPYRERLTVLTKT